MLPYHPINGSDLWQMDISRRTGEQKKNGKVCSIGPLFECLTSSLPTPDYP